MSALEQAIRASGNQQAINAYNEYGVLIEAAAAAAAAGKTGEQIYDDPAVQAALAANPDKAIRWFVQGFLIEGGVIIGGIGFDMN
jgi:hypothetical protein